MSPSTPDRPTTASADDAVIGPSARAAGTRRRVLRPNPGRVLVLATVLAVALVAAACSGTEDAATGSGVSDAATPGATTAPATTQGPAMPTGPAPYLDAVYRDVVVTPKDEPLVLGAAPPIDPQVGTPGDPRARRTDADGNELILGWVAEARDDTSAARPAIVWVHGGGFRAGDAYPLAADVGAQYAQRGYVGLSVEYRMNTTSDCQQVQDQTAAAGADVWQQGTGAAGGALARAGAVCAEGVQAAQRDTQAAVRWLRAHADELRIDPDRIAVGGFSAGAVTAVNVAVDASGPGTWSYWLGDDPATGSGVQAALGASGCTYRVAALDAADAPVSLIASEQDQLVPYGCVQSTVSGLRAAGVTAELTSYCDDRLHAMALYRAHTEATDQQWIRFLARELGLYRDVPDWPTTPFCT